MQSPSSPLWLISQAQSFCGLLWGGGGGWWTKEKENKKDVRANCQIICNACGFEFRILYLTKQLSFLYWAFQPLHAQGGKGQFSSIGVYHEGGAQSFYSGGQPFVESDIDDGFYAMYY